MELSNSKKQQEDGKIRIADEVNGNSTRSEIGYNLAEESFSVEWGGYAGCTFSQVKRADLPNDKVFKSGTLGAARLQGANLSDCWIEIGDKVLPLDKTLMKLTPKGLRRVLGRALFDQDTRWSSCKTTHREIFRRLRSVSRIVKEKHNDGLDLRGACAPSIPVVLSVDSPPEVLKRAVRGTSQSDSDPKSVPEAFDTSNTSPQLNQEKTREVDAAEIVSHRSDDSETNSVDVATKPEVHEASTIPQLNPEKVRQEDTQDIVDLKGKESESKPFDEATKALATASVLKQEQSESLVSLLRRGMRKASQMVTHLFSSRSKQNEQSNSNWYEELTSRLSSASINEDFSVSNDLETLNARLDKVSEAKLDPQDQRIFDRVRENTVQELTAEPAPRSLLQMEGAGSVFIDNSDPLAATERSRKTEQYYAGAWQQRVDLVEQKLADRRCKVESQNSTESLHLISEGERAREELLLAGVSRLRDLGLEKGWSLLSDRYDYVVSNMAESIRESLGMRRWLHRIKPVDLSLTCPGEIEDILESVGLSSLAKTVRERSLDDVLQQSILNAREANDALVRLISKHEHPVVQEARRPKSTINITFYKDGVSQISEAYAELLKLEAECVLLDQLKMLFETRGGVTDQEFAYLRHGYSQLLEGGVLERELTSHVVRQSESDGPVAYLETRYNDSEYVFAGFAKMKEVESALSMLQKGDRFMCPLDVPVVVDGRHLTPENSEEVATMVRLGSVKDPIKNVGIPKLPKRAIEGIGFYQRPMIAGNAYMNQGLMTGKEKRQFDLANGAVPFSLWGFMISMRDLNQQNISLQMACRASSVLKKQIELGLPPQFTYFYARNLNGMPIMPTK